MKLRTFVSSLVMVAAVSTAAAAPVMLNAKLDSASMLMGTLNTIHLEVVQDKGVKGRFPLFEKYGPEGIVTLLNDTVELGRPTRIDTVEVGSGRIQINYELPIRVFDSGVYKLPEFVYASGPDTARSKALLLTVTPVNVTVNDSIAPLTDVADPENQSILDSVPDTLYYYWWAFLLGILLIAIGILAWMRHKKGISIIPKRPEKTPYEQAIYDLRLLKSRKLWESGREKEYYTELTDILRRYLDGRFGIKAMEMTSSEIMSHLADMSSQTVPRDKIRDILDMADFVKFAMVRPLPDDNVALYKNALDFVESTRPSNNEETTTDKTSSLNEDETSEPKVNVGLRGRKGRRDNSAEKISGPRMKVGKGKTSDRHNGKGLNRSGKEVKS